MDVWLGNYATPLILSGVYFEYGSRLEGTDQKILNSQLQGGKKCVNSDTRSATTAVINNKKEKEKKKNTCPLETPNKKTCMTDWDFVPHSYC